MILVDTGPLVALFDPSDRQQEACLQVLRDFNGSLVTAWPVLTEAFYLLNFSWKAQDNLWEFLARGALDVVHLDKKAMSRCRVLMNKYKDFPMDLADSAVVAIAEAMRINTIFTLDHKHFSVYRPRHVKGFELLPKAWHKELLEP